MVSDHSSHSVDVVSPVDINSNKQKKGSVSQTQ